MQNEHHEAAGARALIEALGHAMGTTQITVSAQSLRAVLIIAQEAGLTMTEIASKVGGKQSTVSRTLLDLGNTKRNGDSGHRLVYAVPHPSGNHAKSYFLTSRGHKLVDEMAMLLETGRSKAQKAFGSLKPSIRPTSDRLDVPLSPT